MQHSTTAGEQNKKRYVGDFKSFFNGTDLFAIETVEIKKILVVYELSSFTRCKVAT